MQDIENAIKGLESIPDDRDPVGAAPSPYGPLLPLPLSDLDEPDSYSTPRLPHGTRIRHNGKEGRGLLFPEKKRGILDLLNRWILEDEMYKRRTSKTARVVGHVAGDITGQLVSEQFRMLGTLAGSLAKEGVKEIATAGIDGIIRAFISRS